MPTLKEYLRTFKTVEGLFTAAIGLGAPGLAVLDMVAPPESGLSAVPENAVIAALILGLAVLGTYASCRWRALRDRASHEAGLVALAAGGVLAAVYLLYLMPTYIYTPEPGDIASPRLIVADEAGYSDTARAHIVAKKGYIPKRTLIEGSRIEDLFTEDSLFWARLKLLSVYYLSVLLLEVGFCFLVYAEAARGPERPAPGRR